MTVTERFLKYVGYETTSSENIKEDRASTESQYALEEELKKELLDLGCKDVYMNKFGTVHGFLEGNEEEPIFLNAHVDTSPSASDKDVKPRIIKDYDGKDITLSKGIVMSVSDFPTLKEQKGDDLIVTDGKTLLGGDDKAGIAIIMDVVEKLSKKGKAHRPIEVAFSTDEEVGVGASHIDIDKVKSKFGYTVDGGDIRYISFENFNASSMKVTIAGKSIHPGSAKDKMINAVNVAIEFHDALPRFMRPEDTEMREGFFHLCGIEGTEEKCEMSYIIRDHDEKKLQWMIDYANLAARRINDRFGEPVVQLTIKHSYDNMRPIIEKHMDIIKRLTDIYEEMKIPYDFEPVRGGTDGAELTTNSNFPCPNLGTGGFNCHGRFEYVDIKQMEKMADIVIRLFK
jgi:tripeptide aminopeptidase